MILCSGVNAFCNSVIRDAVFPFLNKYVAWIFLMAVSVVCAIHLPFVHYLSHLAIDVLDVAGAFDTLLFVAIKYHFLFPP